MRHCYYPAEHSADPHLRLRDWAGGGGGGFGGIGGGNGSGVSDIEGVLDGEEEKELRLNAGRRERRIGESLIGLVWIAFPKILSQQSRNTMIFYWLKSRCQFRRKNFGLKTSMKISMRSKFDSVTCLNKKFLHCNFDLKPSMKNGLNSSWFTCQFFPSQN